ncbi:protein INCA1 isoform X2 [Ambystoma mexicanum]
MRAAEIASSHNTQCCNNGLWNRLEQQTSLNWMEENKTSPSLMSSCAVQRPDSLPDAISLQMLSRYERLPSPAELCSRKKGKRKGKKTHNRQVMSVCYHLEDLKRRQSTIDQLKKMQWGGYGAQPRSECLEEDDITSSDIYIPEEIQSTEQFGCLEEQRDSALCMGQHRFLTSGQLIYPQWSPYVEETFSVSEERPMVSYIMATADRQNTPSTGCLSQERFWGCQHQPEE